MSGWGRFTWGQAYWGEDDLLATGWGAKSLWLQVNWGDLSGEVVSLTGLSISTNIELLNPVTVTFDISGLVEPLGIAATFSIGSITNVIDVTTLLTGEEITFSAHIGTTYNRYRC
jgi:predicted xylose isomerase-like sugar epimerase